MSKKILSLIVILCTTICVGIMIYSSKVNINENSVKGKVEVINQDKKGNKENSKKQNAENEIKSNVNDEASKKSIEITDSYKKNKIEAIEDKINQDKDEVFAKDNSSSSKESQVAQSKGDDNKNNTNSNNEKDVSVFKVSKSEIKDDLTIADKEKLLSIGSKLSAVDYEKINEYLKNGNKEDIKNTIKLLKERLSDKDYKKVQQVAEKFINMDLVDK